jgi:hypothetical protein
MIFYTFAHCNLPECRFIAIRRSKETFRFRKTQAIGGTSASLAGEAEADRQLSLRALELAHDRKLASFDQGTFQHAH